jgi:hypothetical protein
MALSIKYPAKHNFYTHTLTDSDLKVFFMQLVYLQFDSLAHLKKFTKKVPSKKVFIMLDRQVLLAQFSDKEIEFAVGEFQAEVVNPVIAGK